MRREAPRKIRLLGLPAPISGEQQPFEGQMHAGAAASSFEVASFALCPCWLVAKNTALRLLRDVHLGPDDVEAKHDVSEAKHDVVPGPHDVVEAKHDVIEAKHDVIKAKHDVIEAKHVIKAKHDVICLLQFAKSFFLAF